jgi:hypothetical protein
MRLTELLRAIQGSPGAVTVADLARQLGSTPETVRAMLIALRAAGRLGPEAGARPAAGKCTSAGSCSVACPGPAGCPLAIDLGSGLRLRAGCGT